jgi:hypothetical protein
MNLVQRILAQATPTRLLLAAAGILLAAVLLAPSLPGAATFLAGLPLLAIALCALPCMIPLAFLRKGRKSAAPEGQG